MQLHPLIRCPFYLTNALLSLEAFRVLEAACCTDFDPASLGACQVAWACCSPSLVTPEHKNITALCLEDVYQKVLEWRTHPSLLVGLLVRRRHARVEGRPHGRLLGGGSSSWLHGIASLRRVASLSKANGCALNRIHKQSYLQPPICVLTILLSFPTRHLNCKYPTGAAHRRRINLLTHMHTCIVSMTFCTLQKKERENYQRMRNIKTSILATVSTIITYHPCSVDLIC